MQHAFATKFARGFKSGLFRDIQVCRLFFILLSFPSCACPYSLPLNPLRLVLLKLAYQRRDSSGYTCALCSWVPAFPKDAQVQ